MEDLRSPITSSLYVPHSLVCCVSFLREFPEGGFRTWPVRQPYVWLPQPRFNGQFSLLPVFRREKVPVYFHAAMKAVGSASLAYHVAQFVCHLPYGAVTLAPKLPLDILGGYGALGGGEQEYGGDPVPYRQVAALYHCPGTQRRLMTAIHARPRAMAVLQIIHRPPQRLQ